MLELIQRIQANPKDRSLLATLCERNTGLARKIAARFLPMCALRGDVGFDDLLQEGYLALIMAAMTYQPGDGKTWPGWAAWYLKNAMARALGAKHQTDAHGLQHSIFPPVAVYLNEPLPGSDGVDGETTRLDLLEDADTPTEGAALMLEDMRKAVRQAVDALPANYADIVRSTELDGMRVSAVARMHGMAYSSVSGMRARGLAALHRNPEMVRLAREYDLDRQTDFYRHKGVAAFQRDFTSATEAAAMWRMNKREDG